MATEIKIPSPGESISEVEIASWFVADGDIVEKDQEIGEIESEKATLPLIAEVSGEVKLLKKEGDTVAVGTVVCTIDESKAGSEKDSPEDTDTKEKSSEDSSEEISKESSEKPSEEPSTEKTGKKETEDSVKPEEKEEAKPVSKENTGKKDSKVKATPLARKIMDEEGLSMDDVLNGLKKISSREVNMAINAGKEGFSSGSQTNEPSREENRVKMSNLRSKLSQRLVAVKNETAMLTTFNEADMSSIMSLRKKYQDKFTEKHGIKLGFMSFFTKAVTEALKLLPQVNSRIEDDEIVSPDYCDIGIAVQTDKGLMVPVIRNTEALSLADIEKEILELASKARKNRLSIQDMTGGTFTITNGGVFGSMMSTPIINPPQAAILGMHTIMQRPIAVNGKVEIRPMMYLALSYDHRIIDGKDSVSFLVKVREFVENPEQMLFGGQSQEKILLDL